MTRFQRHRRLAWAWLALVVLACGYNVKIWLIDHRPLETDFLALLPVDAADSVVQYATDHFATSADQTVLTLVGSHDWNHARAAGAAYSSVIEKHPALFDAVSLSAIASDSALAPWWNDRRALLTPDDRAALVAKSPADLAQTAVHDLISPLGMGQVGSWQDDPFGTFGRWLRAHGADTPVRMSDGVLRVDDGDMHYAVFPVKLRGQAFARQAQQVVVPVLTEARAAAERTGSDVIVRAAGLVFPAAAAATQANKELNIIGWGSTVAIILITWVTFRSLRPIGLVLLSLAVGSIGAVAVTAFVYPRVHLLTLVFGASLIGVAEDYGTHFLCVSDRHRRGTVQVMYDLLPSLSLAVLTTVVSFVGLAISPFPGLKQIALFGVAGLLSSWLTVVLWFPGLDGPQVGSARVVAWFEALRVRWLALAEGRSKILLAVAVTVLSAIGIARLRADDDIRRLQSLPPDMLQEQIDVGRIMRLPFSAQFYVIRAPNEGELLQREEVLRVRLDSLVGQKALIGYQAISTWVPSPGRQQTDAALEMSKLYSPGAAIDQLRAALGEDASWANAVRVKAAAASSPLTVSGWLASPLSEPFRQLWIGRFGGNLVSVVILAGADDSQMSKLERAAVGIPGVVWADKVSSISSILGRYRVRMSWVLAASYVFLVLLLMPRYGRRAFRVVAPSVLASVVVLAVLGLTGHPLQLFHVLALYVVFGLGVDYAIFLTEQNHSPQGDTSFAVGLAAISTVLSLGLLALSATPVLSAFGWTMLIGISVSLLAAPLFCTVAPSAPISAPAPIDAPSTP